jgi:hypothetical protein
MRIAVGEVTAVPLVPVPVDPGDLAVPRLPEVINPLPVLVLPVLLLSRCVGEAVELVFTSRALPDGAMRDSTFVAAALPSARVAVLRLSPRRSPSSTLKLYRSARVAAIERAPNAFETPPWTLDPLTDPE